MPRTQRKTLMYVCFVVFVVLLVFVLEIFTRTSSERELKDVAVFS